MVRRHTTAEDPHATSSRILDLYKFCFPIHYSAVITLILNKEKPYLRTNSSTITFTSFQSLMKLVGGQGS